MMQAPDKHALVVTLIVCGLAAVFTLLVLR